MSTVIRRMILPEILVEYNWDGRANKKTLKDVKLFQQNLYGNIDCWKV